MSSSSAAGCRAGRGQRARAGRQAGRHRRPGERGQPRRPGVLVLRRPVPGRHPPAAAPGRPGLLRAGLAGLAGQRRLGPAERDHPEDEWAAQWGRAYVEFAAGEKRPWLQAAGRPVHSAGRLGRARRRPAGGHGNSVPRFHVPWGTGTGVSEPFADQARAAAQPGRVRFHHRHRVDGLVVDGGAVTGVRGAVLAPRRRGARRRLQPGRGRRVRAAPPRRWCSPPAASAPTTTWSGAAGRTGWAPRRRHMITGVPAHVDGRMLDIAEAVRGTAGQPRPHVALHRGHPELGPRSGRATASGSCPARRRCGSTRSAAGCPRPGCPGYDTLGTLRCCGPPRTSRSTTIPGSSSPRAIIEKEFALSGLGAEPRPHRP